MKKRDRAVLLFNSRKITLAVVSDKDGFGCPEFTSSCVYSGASLTFFINPGEIEGMISDLITRYISATGRRIGPMELVLPMQFFYIQPHVSVVDVNGVGDETTKTTFLAKHMPGTYVPDIDAAVPKVQEHAGLGKVRPNENPNGGFTSGATNGFPIAITSNGSKIGYATFTIFIEGWDHSVIDQNAGYGFNLALKFEIDRAG